MKWKSKTLHVANFLYQPHGKYNSSNLNSFLFLVILLLENSPAHFGKAFK